MENSYINPDQYSGQHPHRMPNQQIIIQQVERKGNGMGTAGFVLALLGLVFCWIPVLDWILWILGLVFSAIGVFKAPRGLEIAGLAISFIGFIILIVFAAAVFASFL